MIIQHKINSTHEGPNVLVLGAVHGNEKCGTVAINKILDEYIKGDLFVSCGSLTLVPIVNQRAYDADVRYVENNLNRVIKRTAHPSSCEHMLANEVCDLIDNCDVLLDLHSFTGEGPPFVFLDYPTQENIAYQKALGLPYSVENWPELYRGADNIASYDTQRYANEISKINVTVECGSHAHSDSSIIAYESIVKTLQYFGMISVDVDCPSINTQRIKMERMFVRSGVGDRFSKEWKIFELVKRGQLVGWYEDGSKIISEYDSCMVLPKLSGKKGDEFFYLGSLID